MVKDFSEARLLFNCAFDMLKLKKQNIDGAVG